MPRRSLACCLLLAAQLPLAACVGHGTNTAAVAPAAATLAVDLAALWPARRLLAARGTPRKAKITLAGPDGVALLDVTLDLATTGPLTTLGVPTGDRLLLKVVGLDPTGQSIPGLVHRAAGKIVPGTNTWALTAAADAAGRVIEALAAKDAAAGTKVLERLDWVALAAAIPGFARELRAPSAGLLDAAAIAADIHAANGAVPVVKAAYLARAGRVVLTPAAWPPGATATVVVDDPASVATPIEGKPAVIGAVAPGTWTMTVTPDQPGLAPVSQRVTVAAGADTRATVSFGASEPMTRLPGPLGGAAAGVVPLADGTQTLILAGGATVGAGGPGPVGTLFSTVAARYPVVVAPPAATLGEAVGAPAAAVANGKLYWFGGLALAGVTANGWMFDPAGNGTVTARAALPGGGLYGAAAAAIGPKLYLTGGTKPDGTESTATMAYDLAANTWTQAGGPALTPHRSLLASAVVGETWYLIGGFGDAGLAAAQPAGPVQPTSRTSAWKPGTDPGFRDLAPIPTPRAAASAVAANGRIWVIGGVGRDGALTGAVEVYDPATDTWSLRPPLQRPRALPACGLLNGKIVVAGGLLGADPAQHAPVDDVEAYAP